MMLLITSILGGCYAGEIYDRYRLLYPEGGTTSPSKPLGGNSGHVMLDSLTLLQPASPRVAEIPHNITEIGLERTSCRGTCPAYTVVISADGSFRYEGTLNVERIGRYTGRVNTYELNKLAQAIQYLDFNALSTSYSSRLMDVSYQYVQVTEGRDTSIVETTSGNQPIEIWMISTMIDKLLSEARWDQPAQREGF